MKKVKIIAGICWAFAGLILIIILFPGLNSFSASVSKLSFMKLNPRYTGGEIASQVINESCTLDIRKPVFNGFLKDRKSGFIQVDWRGSLPDLIKDTIDYDNDGNKDFIILVGRKESKTDLISFNTKVKGVVISTPASYGWSVRVGLLK
ncbi:MAG TPA: hypothetical protein VF346_05250 [Bacteroidales bacterium]